MCFGLPHRYHHEHAVTMLSQDILLEGPDKPWVLSDFMGKWKDRMQNDDITLSPSSEMLKVRDCVHASFQPPCTDLTHLLLPYVAGDRLGVDSWHRATIDLSAQHISAAHSASAFRVPLQ